jgi:hypothetical protein
MILGNGRRRGGLSRRAVSPGGISSQNGPSLLPALGSFSCAILRPQQKAATGLRRWRLPISRREPAGCRGVALVHRAATFCHLPTFLT